MYSTKNAVGRGTMNMHELSLTNEQRTALMITFESKLMDVSEPGEREEERWMGNNGFVEIDLATNKPVFTWWALDWVLVKETQTLKPPAPGSVTSIWDFFHLNSVDKDVEGNYIISARYPSCIYKISGVDGHIIWRLGGIYSDFTLDGFNFSSQHNARILSHTPDTTVLSFLNNAADGVSSTASRSAAMIVSLDMPSMTASLLHEFPRPDGELSQLRGSVQVLENGNTFVSWSENGYVTEFTPAGDIVLSGIFASHRCVTYRAYKYNFTAQPAEPPVVKAFAYGPAPSSPAVTAFYASWNGATEVAEWRFYGGNGDSDAFEHVGSASRRGFETQFMVAGWTAYVYAQALAADGTVLGQTALEAVVLPRAWADMEGTVAHKETGIVVEASSEMTETEMNQKPVEEAEEVDGDEDDGQASVPLDASGDDAMWSLRHGVGEPIRSPLGMMTVALITSFVGAGLYTCLRRRARRRNGAGFAPLKNEFSDA